MPEDNKTRVPHPKFAMKGSYILSGYMPINKQSFVPGAFLDSEQMSGAIPNEPSTIKKIFNKFARYFGKHKKKFLVSMASMIGLALIVWTVIFWLPVGLLVWQTKSLANSDYNEEIKKAWADQVNNFKFFTQLKTPNTLVDENTAFGNAVLTYMNGYKEFNKYYWIKLPSMTIENAKEVQVDLEPAPIETDNTLALGYSYFTPPVHVNFEKYMTAKLNFEGVVSQELKFLIAHIAFQSQNIVVRGQADNDQSIVLMNNSIRNLIEALKQKNISDINTYLTGDDAGKAQNFMDSQAELKLKNFMISDQIKDATNQVDLDNQLFIGQYNFVNSSQNKSISLIVYYDYVLKHYAFDGLVPLIKSISNISNTNTSSSPAYSSSAGVKMLNCKDCTLAPVDKINELSSNYIPKVENINVNGGGQLTPAANTSLKKLFNDASTKGLSMTVISSYRSYATQVTTYNYWVTQNMKGGVSRAEAEIKANKVSAKPGHSEHQLGTTVDLKCNGCGSFDNSAGNLAVYKYLEENAYRYGFAISYAKGTTESTGYNYEPWHIRYIGENLASEFYNTGYLSQNGNYLAKFLTEKALY